jgi:hypothetical protein
VKKTKTNKPALRLEWIEAGSLAANPNNWRRHPAGQARAFKALLSDVGWAGALLYNERTRRLIDGHLRQKSVPPRTAVPVLIGNWDEEAEKKILATLDPLAMMAIPDVDALDSLLAEADLAGDELGELTGMLDGLVERAEASDDRTARAEAIAGAGAGAGRRHGATMAERYQIVIECPTEKEQQKLFRRLKGQGLRCRMEVT